MFRIKQIFENEYTLIVKIEGRVLDESAETWASAIEPLTRCPRQSVILDFSQVWFICPKALNTLRGILYPNIYMMNCPIELRNILHTAGEATHILE